MELHRYPQEALQVTTQGGKRTAELLCRPVRPASSARSAPPITQPRAASRISLTHCENTVPSVNSVAALLEIATTSDKQNYLMTFKQNPELHIAELHGVSGKKSFSVKDRKEKLKYLSKNNSKLWTYTTKRSSQTKYQKETSMQNEKCEYEVKTDQLDISMNKVFENSQTCKPEKVLELELETLRQQREAAEHAVRLARQELESVGEARDWYSGQMKHSQQLRAEVAQQADALRQEVDTLTLANQGLRKNIENLENEISLQKKIIQEEPTTCERSTKEELKRQKAALEEANQLLTIQIQSADSLNENLNADKMELQASICNNSKEIEFLRDTNNKLRENSKELQNEITNARSELVSCNKKAIDLKENVECLMAEKEDLLNQFKAEKRDLQNLIEGLEQVHSIIMKNQEFDQISNKNLDESHLIIKEKLLLSENKLQEQKNVNEKILKENEELKLINIGLISSLNSCKEKLLGLEEKYKSLKSEKNINENKKIKSLEGKILDKDAEIKSYIKKIDTFSSSMEIFKKTEVHNQNKLKSILEENISLKQIKKESEKTELRLNSELNRLEIKCHDLIETVNLNEGKFNQINQIQSIELKKISSQLAKSEKKLSECENERKIHRKQLRQMQLALKNSLLHIRGLRTILETSLPVYKRETTFDEESLSSLLSLDAASDERPRLNSLRLCLAGLRREVGELNISLGSSDLSGTTSPSDPLSFLEDCPARDVSEGSNTPSLHLASSFSSPSSSPEQRR